MTETKRRPSMPPSIRTAATLAAIACLALAGVALGQSDEGERADPPTESPGEFQFVRLAYSVNRFMNYGGRNQAWQTDYPDAEHHFLKGVDRLTTVDAAEQGVILVPLDADIYDYPWIYAVGTGISTPRKRRACATTCCAAAS